MLCHSLLLFAVFRQSVYRRQFMRGREVSVSDSHLNVFVARELLDRSQINSGHDEARDIGVAKDVPGDVSEGRISLDRFLHHQFKPGTGRCHWLTVSRQANLR